LIAKAEPLYERLPDHERICTMESSTYDDEAAQTDGGYGWVCVAACWIFNAFTWGGVSVSSLQIICIVPGLWTDKWCFM
jgi:hypothetical protein